MWLNTNHWNHHQEVIIAIDSKMKIAFFKMAVEITKAAAGGGSTGSAHGPGLADVLEKYLYQVG
jgi:hypothetical protein